MDLKRSVLSSEKIGKGKEKNCSNYVKARTKKY